MFFKIEKTGCGEFKGTVEVRYDLYLDPSDARHHEHYIDVPIFPEEDYTGDPGNFASWVESLPHKKQHNPFCCHFVQFDYNQCSDEEILVMGEYVLQEKYKHWIDEDLSKPLNKHRMFHPHDEDRRNLSQKRINEILTIDFVKGKYK